MNPMLAKVEELIALTTRLAALVEDDVSTLRGRRPGALEKNEADRTTATLLYAKAAAEFKAPATVAALPPTTRARLKAATARLHTATREQNRLLTTFRHVTEGMIKAIADVVAAKSMPSAYAKTGAFAKPATPMRATALTLNQAV